MIHAQRLWISPEFGNAFPVHNCRSSVNMVPLATGKFSNGSKWSLSGHQPVPHELFECECTYFLEQIINVLVFSPQFQVHCVELLYHISKKYSLVKHGWGNKLESSEISISKKCLIWRSSPVNLSIRCQWLRQLLSYCLTASSPPGCMRLWEALQTAFLFCSVT